MKAAKKLTWSIVCSMAILAMGVTAPAQAHDMGDKALRGLAGMTCFVLELPGSMVDVSNKDGILSGLTVGFAKGLVMMPFRGMVGVYELFTFPFDIQPGYAPVLEPEYPWGYFGCCDKTPAAPKK